MSSKETKRPEFFASSKECGEDVHIIDAYDGLLRELFFATHPHLKEKVLEAEEQCIDFKKRYTDQGLWVYYPWRNTAVHILNEDDTFLLRTARNKNIITKEEQDTYRTLRVGIAGLSVGSSVLTSLVGTGGPKNIKIADFDVLEMKNLNRIHATLLDLGEEKVVIAGRNAWELDPFLELDLWDKGVSADSIERFILKPRLDVFIDEMDDIALKLEARLICKKHGIPVVMATDNGDGTILDVERYDKEGDTEPFFGRIGSVSPDELRRVDQVTWLRYATKIIGAEFMTEELQSSLLQVGKDISGPPQLFSAAAVSGAAVSYAVRCMATGRALRSGKYAIPVESALITDYTAFSEKE